MKKLLWMLPALVLLSLPTWSQKKSTGPTTNSEKKYWLGSDVVNGLKFRSIGPAITSGRVADIVVNPSNKSEYYVAAASGGVWKTTNGGATFESLFDNEGSYSIGCLAIDPSNHHTIWVGSGENNNQRSVAYGDGIYKSMDDGKTWQNLGLKNSEHIGRIAIDPQDGNIVYVAAYGPLWSSGGDRGIYKTTDGGITWKQVLQVSEHTGFNEVMIDPRHSNIIYAAAHQRQRKVFTYIGGGPESALYKSTDGGATWSKIMNGLPNGDLGRIGLQYAPANPDILYCSVEANEGRGGFFKSTDRGASWQKQSSYFSSGNYYQKVFCDPKNVNRVFVSDTYLMVSDDGGKNFKPLGEKNKHIDNHALWIDDADTNHYLVGCDGGVYESFNAGQDWLFKPNLPITQFYKVSTDNDLPFYHIHGGTQDNFSLGGPSRTISSNGVFNSDWYFTSIGDGFESQVDPTNPNIVYAQAQYGALVRYDRKSGEMVNIQPQEPLGEAYRWNWDAPLLISHHDPKRIYFAANKVFRTNDRGNSWQAISPDLSSGIDRNKLPVMGKTWSVDAIAKNQSTDIFGNITTLAESKFDENLLYAGTDDGLIQVTQDGGKTWTRCNTIAGVPEQTYVNQIITSLHDRNTAYVTFNHHRYGNFKPFVYKTTDGGKTWSAIQNDLPDRGTAYSIAEDHVNASLLFVGTEFGVFTSLNGGTNWVAMKGGLPTIAVRDIEIQRRENDLVLATFGRGFYVLDDYSPLRSLSKDLVEKPASIFPVKESLMFLPSTPLGVRGKGFQGESFFTADNPPLGTVFTYYVKEDLKTLKQIRQAKEQESKKNNQAIYYPSMDSLRMEDNQPAPHLLFTVANPEGEVIRRIKAPATKGLKRIIWDYRVASFSPIDFNIFDESNAFASPNLGHIALPGNYTISLQKFENGVYSQLVAPQPFVTKTLNNVTLPATDRAFLDQFSKEVGAFARIFSATDSYRGELENKLRYMKQAVLETSGLQLSTTQEITQLEARLTQINTLMNGDRTLMRREFATSPSLSNRIYYIVGSLWNASAAPTQSQIDNLRHAKTAFKPAYEEIKSIDQAVKNLEAQFEKNKAPYTPGRLPIWD